MTPPSSPRPLQEARGLAMDTTMVNATAVTARELRVYWMAKQGFALEEIAFHLPSGVDESAQMWLEEKRQCEAVDAVIEANILKAVAT